MKRDFLKKGKLFFVFTLILCLTACSLVNRDLRGFLEYYTGSAAIAAEHMPELSGRANNGIRCISSDQDQTITFSLRNPQGYSGLVVNYIYANEEVEALGVKPEFHQSEDCLSMTMTFPKTFLQNLEKGSAKNSDGVVQKDLSGTIKVSHPTVLDLEFESYDFSLMVDTPPERIRGAMFQLTGTKSTNPNYVVAFNAYKVTGTVHAADTKHIYIGKNHWTFTGDFSTITPVEVEDGVSLSTSKPVSQLYDLDDNESTFTALTSEGYVPLYFKSNKICDDSGQVLTYKISIVDDYNLSANTTITNQPDKLQPPDFTTIDAKSWNKGESGEEDDIAYPADEESEEFRFVINHEGHTFYIDEDGEPRAGATCTNPIMIQYVVKQDGTVVQKGIKQAPVTLRLKSAVDYTVEAYAYSDGIIDSVNAGTKKFGVSRSNIYYVDAGVPAGGTGSKTKPYNTVEECFDTISQQCTNFNSSGPYVINLMSDISATDATVINLENKSYFANTEVTIQGYNRVRKIKVQKSSGSGSPKGISIPTSTPDMTLNLNNLEITNENGYGIMVYNDSNVIDLNLENVTVRDCNSNNEAGGIYFSNTNGKLALSNVTVTNNTCMTGGAFAGGGILLDKGSIEVKNQVIIKNNVWINTTSDEEKTSNLYLNKVDDNQIPIIIKGKLSAGSQIGVRCAVAPEGDEPVIFTEGYSIDNNNINPGLIFTSDDNIGITLDEDYSDGEVCLLLNRGSFTDILKSVSIKLNCRENYFIPGQSKTILITPKLHIYDEEKKGADYLNKLGWKTWLTCDGVTVGTVKTGTGSNIIYEIPASGLTEDVFVLHVQAWYNFDADNKSQIFDDEYILYPPKSMDKLSAAPTNGCYYVTEASELGRIKTWSISGSVFENVTFVLEKDITVNSVNNFCITKYSGIFDGNGKKITVNLTAGGTWFALFKEGDNCLIRNTTMNGTINTTYSTVGAFIGYAQGDNNDLESINVIENCINNVNITSDKTYVGGFVGFARSLCIRNSVNNGTIECNQTITRKADCNVGGFVGAIEAGSGVQLYIENCVNNGEIVKTDYTNIQNANKRAGGIIGGMDYPNISVKNVAMAGKITDGCEMAAILYKSYDKNFNNCYYLNGSGIGEWYLGTYNSNYVNGFSSKQQIVNQLNTWIDNQTDSFIYKKWKVESDKIVFN